MDVDVASKRRWKNKRSIFLILILMDTLSKKQTSERNSSRLFFICSSQHKTRKLRREKCVAPQISSIFAKDQWIKLKSVTLCLTNHLRLRDNHPITRVHVQTYNELASRSYVVHTPSKNVCLPTNVWLWACLSWAAIFELRHLIHWRAERRGEKRSQETRNLNWPKRDSIGFEAFLGPNHDFWTVWMEV